MKHINDNTRPSKQYLRSWHTQRIFPLAIKEVIKLRVQAIDPQDYEYGR